MTKLGLQPRHGSDDPGSGCGSHKAAVTALQTNGTAAE